MSSAVADPGTVQALTSLDVAPKQHFIRLPAGPSSGQLSPL